MLGLLLKFKMKLKKQNQLVLIDFVGLTVTFESVLQSLQWSRCKDFVMLREAAFKVRGIHPMAVPAGHSPENVYSRGNVKFPQICL